MAKDKDEVAPEPEVVSNPANTAKQNGIKAVEYGRRVLANQGMELNDRFKGANIRAALEGQGYDDIEIKAALKELKLG
jgi:hypothetical protein